VGFYQKIKTKEVGKTTLYGIHGHGRFIQMNFAVDEIAWTMNQRLEDEQYGGWELLSPRKVKITEIYPPLHYTALLCDENGNAHPDDTCRCKEYELYKTQQEATIAYKDRIEYEISKLKNLLEDYTNTLTLLNHEWGRKLKNDGKRHK